MIGTRLNLQQVTQQLPPRAMGILSLPIEIIQLTDYVRSGFSKRSHLHSNHQDLRLKMLRLVCSKFNRALEAQGLFTLVILVSFNTLKQSIDMFYRFALQNEKVSRAVQLARTLKIKYLSSIIELGPEFFQIPQHEPENYDLPSSPSTLINRLASALSSLKRRFK